MSDWSKAVFLNVAINVNDQKCQVACANKSMSYKVDSDSTHFPPFCVSDTEMIIRICCLCLDSRLQKIVPGSSSHFAVK